MFVAIGGPVPPKKVKKIKVVVTVVVGCCVICWLMLLGAR